MVAMDLQSKHIFPVDSLIAGSMNSENNQLPSVNLSTISETCTVQ